MATPITPITIENAQTGDSDWWVPYPQWAKNHEVEGIVDRLSYNAGETVNVMVSSRVGSNVHWRLYRVGWYESLGARLVVQGDATATPQPLPPSSTWEVPAAAKWPVTFSIPLDEKLVSGVFALRLDAGGHTQFTTFVVRNDGRPADLVVQRSDFTDAMYNNWDGDKERSSWYGDQPQFVSLDRVQRTPSALVYPYSAGFFTYEVSAVRFLEQQGYDVTYISNRDTHDDDQLQNRGKVFVSMGHDEYWTAEMRDHVELARNAGMHLLILSSDTCDGILRFNPQDPSQVTVTNVGATKMKYTRATWGDLPVNVNAPPHDNPEDTLIGTHYGGWCGQFSNACLNEGFDKLKVTQRPVLTDPSHPVLRNLPLMPRFQPFMGYEYEVRLDNFSPPNLRQIANIPEIVEFESPPVIVAYQRDDGTRVFNVGSMMFAHALDGWGGRAVFRNHGGERSCDSLDSDCFDVEDYLAQQMAVNVLSDMGAERQSPRGNFSDGLTCDWNHPSIICLGDREVQTAP